MDFRFSRQYRLLSKHDFQLVFAGARKVTCHDLLALYRPNQRLYARLGIIISKQAVPRAVHRNQIKRIIRESFRQDKETVKGLDIVVMVQSKPRELTVLLHKEMLRETVEGIWQRIAKALQQR